MNRIKELFNTKKNDILSVYFTAGYPELNNTATIIKELVYSGVDMIEIGMPFSDPLADGPVIQHSSTVALKNGMNLHTLFAQLEGIRKEVSIPLILMGYVNPVIQFGFEAFCKKCSEIGIDGLIIPDLPMYEYQKEYKAIVQKYKLDNIFLISPQTSEERIRLIDEETTGFIYMVSSSSTTGAKAGGFGSEQIQYFERVKAMGLKNPLMIGFGISNNETYTQANTYAHGAIIGSGFIKALENTTDIKTNVKTFVHKIRKQ